MESMNPQIITLSKDLPIPLYHQLKTLLLERIRTGEMKPNDRLPAEDVLAATHGVSKATVRQALNELAIAGVLRREQGRGTFVAEPMGIQTAYLSLALAPQLDQEDFTDASLYEVLDRKYGLWPARAQETYVAVLLERAESKLLKAAAATPALSAERVSYLTSGQPLELTYSIMRGDRYKIVLDLTRHQLRA